MLLQETPSLEELLVISLGLKPGSTAKELERDLQLAGHAFSLRGIYKELNKLAGQGILFKNGDTYNIHLIWIMKLLAFGDAAFEQYTTTPYLIETLQADGAKRVERFSDIRKLDRLWTQLILALHTIYPKKIMCFWCPYQWFSLAQQYVSKQFYEAIDLTSYQRCHIIGNDSYLSRQARKDLPKNGLYSFAESPFHLERSTYYTLIGDCLITVKLDKAFTDKLEILFSSVKRKSDIDTLQINALFDSRVRASLVVERNEDKAARLRKKFSAFFGIAIE